MLWIQWVAQTCVSGTPHAILNGYIMNTHSPFVPQGTTPPRDKSGLYFKVLLIAAIHVGVISGMLLQGCKDTAEKQSKDSTTNSAEAGYAVATNADTNSPVSMATLSNNQLTVGLPAAQTSAPPQFVATNPLPPPVAVAAPASPSGDYAIVRGDTLAAIAKAQHISLKALMDANPGVNAKRLQIGQKLQIPGAAASLESSPVAESAEAGGSVYVVKAGDTLAKIAHQYGISYKRLMALNDLKTTSIRVGQKLKTPAPKAAAAAAAPASAATAQPGPAASSTSVSATAAPAPASTRSAD